MTTNSTILHPVMLHLTEAERQQLSTLASYYKLTEGEFLTLAFRQFTDEVDIIIIPSQVAE